jgi:hypothetical protein
MKWAVLLLPLLGGCYSLTVVGRARTVEKGRWELLAAPGLTGVAVTNADADVRPSAEVGARYGATDRMDLGLRVSDSGASAAARVQLERSPDSNRGVDVMVAPGLAYTVTDKLAVEVPLLLGINFCGGHQLVLAPRLVYQLLFGVGGQAAPVPFLFMGGSVAFVWQVRPRWALVPELGVLANVYSEPGFSSFAQAGPAVQASVGILWDP